MPTVALRPSASKAYQLLLLVFNRHFGSSPWVGFALIPSPPSGNGGPVSLGLNVTGAKKGCFDGKTFFKVHFNSCGDAFR